MPVSILHYINSNSKQTTISTPQPGFSTFAQIDTGILNKNIQLLKKQAGNIKIMAVVKADAYGHGVAAISGLLADAGINRFMVATLNEAIQLRTLQPIAQILVASPPHPENLEVYQNLNLDASITSDEIAQSVLEAASNGLKLSVHAKIETGMNRLGISIKKAPSIIQRLLASPGIQVAGIWSHLASAGDSDKSFALQQIEKAYAVVNQFPSFKGYFHVGNSGALLNLRNHIGILEKELVRLGGAFLGIPASQKLAKDFGLLPVMTLKSRVIHVKALEPGDSVSYGRTWKAHHPTQIAIIGAGYADGYPSALSGKANVYVHNTPYPIIGRVCMDMFMIDLGVDNVSVNTGDEVFLFGDERVNIYDLGDLAGLVHYEICCRIPMRVPRHLK